MKDPQLLESQPASPECICSAWVQMSGSQTGLGLNFNSIHSDDTFVTKVSVSFFRSTASLPPRCHALEMPCTGFTYICLFDGSIRLSHPSDAVRVSLKPCCPSVAIARCSEKGRIRKHRLRCGNHSSEGPRPFNYWRVSKCRARKIAPLKSPFRILSIPCPRCIRRMPL